jgi:5'-deoxynucleotidase YfbR-like HD superfamily hydrolase
MKHPFQVLDGCFNTISGIKFNLLNPTEEMVNIMDIASGLAFRGHFGGQSPHMFSIAQHSTLVVDLIPDRIKLFNPEFVLVALLHDAEEAYTGDLIKPIKILLPEFEKIANRIRDVIFKKYNLNLNYMPEIKEYDILAQAMEYNQFFKNENNFRYLSPDDAKDDFLNTFNRYESILRQQRKDQAAQKEIR